MTQLPIIERALSFRRRVAVQDQSGQHTFRDLVERSKSIAVALLKTKIDLAEQRVAYLVPVGQKYISVQWGIWRAGGIAVPLSHSATEQELQHTLRDSQASILVATTNLATKFEALSKPDLRIVFVDEIEGKREGELPEIDLKRRAMILYTSGTTSQPKGVVSTHAIISSQIKSLIDAWCWTAEDRIPLFLPLHHIHGIINVMSCALWSGARIESFPKFDMDAIFDRVANDAYTVFMAVPTIYVKMIRALESLTEKDRIPILNGFRKMRLMISGSSALPASVHEQWTNLTSQKLLERYGMTEIGMALSNPYQGERRPGSVGRPLPGVNIRLVTEQDQLVDSEQEPGEIQVRGPSVFLEYWNRPEVTSDSFQKGWFRTGDIATLENGYYRIMGRRSIDIIKSGGYKLSALEIETALLDHSAIMECAVVGIPDETWGEAVAAVVVLRTDDLLNLEGIRAWCRGRMSDYKIPQRLLVVKKLPRNAMGKVTKPALVEMFAIVEPSPTEDAKSRPGKTGP